MNSVSKSPQGATSANGNTAKEFLNRYRALLIRRDSIQRTIDMAYDRAYSTSAGVKEVVVQSNGIPDRMAEEVVNIVEETKLLDRVKAQIEEALAEILKAIDSVQNETQKAVLTLRYVEGLSWKNIEKAIHYERRQTFVIHGRALRAIRRYLEKAHPNAPEDVLE